MNRKRTQFVLVRFAAVVAGIMLAVSCASTRMHQQGLSDFDQGNYEVALQKLQQAVAADPGNLQYKVELKGRHDEAVQKLIAEGDRARAASDGDAAIAAYKRVLAIESGNVRAAKGIDGVAADRLHGQNVAQAAQEIQRGEYAQADARLSGVLAEDPGYTPATSLRAKIDTARGAVTVTPQLHTRDDRVSISSISTRIPRILT